MCPNIIVLARHGAICVRTYLYWHDTAPYVSEHTCTGTTRRHMCPNILVPARHGSLSETTYLSSGEVHGVDASTVVIKHGRPVVDPLYGGVLHPRQALFTISG